MPELGSNIVVTVGPEEEKVSIEGQVVYVQPRGPFGIKFTGSCDENLKKLRPVFQDYIKPKPEPPSLAPELNDSMQVRESHK
jgi:hypothetical protein